MAIVRSDWIDVSFDYGPPVIDSVAYSTLQYSNQYDPGTGFIQSNSGIAGAPYAVLGSSNSLIPILSIVNNGIYVDTGLDPNEVTPPRGEGYGLDLVFTYTSDIIIDQFTGRILFTGSGLNWQDMIGSWTNITVPFISQPQSMSLRPIAGAGDGSLVICDMRGFGYWPYPAVTTSTAYQASTLMLSNDNADYNVNFNTAFASGVQTETSGVTTWIKHGNPTISALTGMGPTHWYGSSFANDPYAQYANGFTNTDCYQIDEASIGNWTFGFGILGDPFMVQIICNMPPVGNFLPDRCLFNVGTQGVDGFRILQGDRPGRIYYQSLILQWEYAETEGGPRVGTRESILDFPTWDNPLLITAVRTGADSSGATWRLLLDGTSNWFAEWGNDWPVLWWGNYFNGFLGCYHNTPPAWDTNATYTWDDRVSYNGHNYYSLVDPNQGNTPTVGGDANWAEDVILRSWPGDIWAARWVTGNAGPFDQTFIENEYTQIYSVAQNSQIVNPLYGALHTYYNTVYSGYTYDPGTGYVTGAFDFNPVPNYVVGTSGNMHQVTALINATTIQIATGLALTEVYNGTIEATPTFGDIQVLVATRGDGGTTTYSPVPITVSISEAITGTWFTISGDPAPLSTQTLPSTIPTVANGRLAEWQTGAFEPPSVWRPSSGASGPGLTPLCNPSGGSDWSGSYHGWDALGYGVWDCRGYAPPAQTTTAQLLVANQLIEARGGVYIHGMTVGLYGFQGQQVYFTEYTGSGNPGAGQWKLIDSQHILIRGPDPWPTWATYLQSYGNIGPSQHAAYSASYATNLWYHGQLSLWQYDDTDGYGGIGTRQFVVSNGGGSFYGPGIFCADPVGCAF